MENYFRAKFSIAEALLDSHKRPRHIIANADDARGGEFLTLPIEKRIPFSFADASDAHLGEQGVSFSYKGIPFSLSLPGTFTILNALAAIKTAEALGIPLDTCARALGQLARISGRVERIDAGQHFTVIVDYAHTPDSLQALYSAFPNRRKICVLGNTGGGRDTWKRPEMGRIADEACTKVILTNEDPYDEDPRAIVDAMVRGMSSEGKDVKLQIIMDRREAIRHALAVAREGDAVLISGKGTDPFIMGANGLKESWSDAQVVREELERLLAKF
jgi:UDP-N-acetylmuramoyl-L-alanyl-D-glutamate--2,6-diaminopimelate ligase